MDGAARQPEMLAYSFNEVIDKSGVAIRHIRHDDLGHDRNDDACCELGVEPLQQVFDLIHDADEFRQLRIGLIRHGQLNRAA